MKIWLIIFLAITVPHRVQSQKRLVVNTTCLELARPSNQQFRLKCSSTSHYHCLLDETFTTEFEVCKEWRWISEGKCAYFNTHGIGNIDERNCIQKNNLTCSTGSKDFQSVTNTNYTACYIKKEISTPRPTTTKVPSQSRLVVKTTCLELAKHSNQQLRLNCSNPSDYHCLLDESYTQEYEACRDWKWIPGGKCAYFNTFGRGNIDERNCIQKTNLTCSNGHVQFTSAANTKYAACYVKKEIGTSLPTTASPQGSQSVGGNASLVLTTSEKQYERHIWPTIFGIIVPLFSIAVIYFILMRLKYICILYRKAYPVESLRLSDLERNENNVEQQPFLKKKTESTAESRTTTMHEDETITGARKNGYSDAYDHTNKYESDSSEQFEDAPSSPTIIKQKNSEVSTGHSDANDPTDKNESDSSEQFEDASSSPKIIKQKNSEESTGHSDANDPTDKNESDSSEQFEDASSSPKIIKQKNSEVSTDKHQKGNNDGLESNTCKPAEVGISKDLKEEVSTADKTANEEDTQKLIDVFDDTVQSLQIGNPRDEQEKEQRTMLYKLLEVEGLKLTQQVLTATITRETGKSVKILTDQEKSKLKEMLPEESHRILESKTEHDTSFHVSYGLHRIILDEEKSPKSGWGNPVREEDIEFGDDVERLYRIQTIVQGISNPVTVSVESYIRLLDIMIEAVIRMDPGAEFKKGCELLSYKLESIKKPKPD